MIITLAFEFVPHGFFSSNWTRCIALIGLMPLLINDRYNQVFVFETENYKLQTYKFMYSTQYSLHTRCIVTRHWGLHNTYQSIESSTFM